MVRILSGWVLLAASSEWREAPLLPVAFGKPSGGGGSRPSGSFGGSRPSSPSYSSPSAYKPSPPSYSSPSASRPSLSSPSASRPSVPTVSRPAVKTPTGTIPYNQKSPYNPNPSYKTLNSVGAPTVRSGGGGFGSTAKRVVIGTAAAVATGLAVGYVVNVAAGYFLYGGRYSSPYCRGNEADRFASGYCPRGYSTTSHQCTSQVPMCKILETVRADWNIGPNAPPKVDVSFDASMCSMVPLPAPAATPVATPVASPAEVDSAVPAVNTTITGGDEDTNSTSTGSVDNVNGTGTRSLAAIEGVDGQSGLDNCVQRILAAGGCDSYGAGSLFQYDDATGACGCCSTPQVVPLGNFSAAIYSLRRDLAASSEAPTHCVSGATIHYPSVEAGGQANFRCECGTCADCGSSGPRYLDWSGPFAVSDARGEASQAGATAAPLYDPVDTCVCGDAAGTMCEEVSSFQTSAAAAMGRGGPLGMQWAAMGSLLVLLIGRR